jgi:hypothetical protein
MNDDKQRFPDRDDIDLAEEIRIAKEGNKETLRVMGDVAGDIDKVLELKKDLNKTNAYIKVLEEAHRQQARETPVTYSSCQDQPLTEKRPDGGMNHFLLENGKPTDFYYVKTKPGFFRKLKNISDSKVGTVIVLTTFPLTAFRDGLEFNIGDYLSGVAFMCFLYACGLGLYRWLGYVAQDKKRQRKEYESNKRFVAIVRANGMMVPFPGRKQDYRNALDMVEAYERVYPEETEPHRVWLSPEEWACHSNHALNNKRKPFI